jgi:hypothetical protein
VPEEAAQILTQGYVAHVGFSIEEQVFVIPFVYQFDPAMPDKLYLHGSHASRALRSLANSVPVCVTVTLLDGLVYSRTARSHSVNYRSVVCFGHARRITSSQEKAAVFDRMTSRYFPGRVIGQDYKAPPVKDLDATELTEITIEEWSAKARSGGPLGTMDADPDAPGTSGVIDLREV